MLTRRRVTTPGEIHISRFVLDRGSAPGTGLCSWFHEHGHPGHANREQAIAEWRRRRREGWERVRLFYLPRAAESYDHMSRTAWPLLWSAAQRVDPIDAPLILTAARRDRAAVAQFVDRDPDGARGIHDYLDAWLHCLATIETVTRELAACRDLHARGAVNALVRLQSRHRYGDGAP